VAKPSLSTLAVALGAAALALIAPALAAAVPPPPGSPVSADPDKPNPVGVRDVREGIAPGDPAPGRPGRSAAAVRLDRILTVLVEFAGTDNVGETTYSGPLHNQIP
jgi:hypothetical protein